MKKLIAILLTLCMLCTGVMAFADELPEEDVFTFRNGITFGMNLDDVIAAEASWYHDIDFEDTRGRVSFTELEYENIREDGIRADLTYLFVEDELVAIRLGYETRDIRYNTLKYKLESKYGTAVAVDRTALGNGIYAVDDDGRLERNAKAITFDNVMIVIEQDDDDIDVTFIDLNAAYITGGY